MNGKVKRFIHNCSLTFRLDHPGVQRRLRIGSVKVFADGEPYLIRVYGDVRRLDDPTERLVFERVLREQFDKAIVEELLGKPVEVFQYRRFNQSLAVSDRERATHREVRISA